VAFSVGSMTSGAILFVHALAGRYKGGWQLRFMRCRPSLGEGAESDKKQSTGQE
jgi:hypothetical protein